MLHVVIFGALLACSFGSVLRPQARLPDHRIVGGVETDIKQYPHQLSFRDQNSHICGAAIISSKWALTAAHCVGSPVSRLSVSSGSTDRRTGTVYKIKRIVRHPNYGAAGVNYDNDYALVEIDGEIEFGSTVQPIKLAERELLPGQAVTITGWGTTGPGGSLTTKLMRVSVPIVSRRNCSSAYTYINDITENMICAGATQGGKDSCQGDSGGPLIANNTLYGVVSWGVGCGMAGYPGVYSNVVTARSWIKKVSGV